ncbi:hypothetical protein GCM10023322_54180 [Rugosimonospora acidiphila]|uniref:PKD domain-containing protein n=1 Tax=Rugosimonospora acidiphila TaxID=556531 RepID=A0ABP9SCF4_9ACTN
MRRTGTVSLAVLMVAAAYGLAVPGAASAADAPANLYVDNRLESNCSNDGTGTPDRPYCTLAEAAAAVQPGQTVLIAGSAYFEPLDITKSGTPGNPITFAANPAVTGSDVMLMGDGAGITVTGQHDVTLSSIGVYGDGTTGIAISNSSHITLKSVIQETDNVDAAGVRLAGVSDSTLTGVRVQDNENGGISLDHATTGVTISSSQILGNGRRGAQPAPGVEISGTGDQLLDSSVETNGLGVLIDGGASGTVVANNVVYESIAAGIDNVDTGGTAITSNTVEENCTGILVRGTSAGVSVENNISTENVTSPIKCTTAPADEVGIGVYDDAESSTTVDYNVSFGFGPGAGAYAWGVPVASLAAFQAASGQGAHDINRNPQLVGTTFVPLNDSTPEVDSADASAPGEQDADWHGFPAEDDPRVSNTGHGTVTYRDRGAVELTDGPSALLRLTPTVPTATSGWKFTADASSSTLWAPASTYTFDFGDGTVVTQTTPVATHTYTELGSRNVTVTVKDVTGLTSTATQVAKVGNTFTPLNPVRVLDTRGRIGVSTTTPVAPFSTVSLQVAGVAGVPASGVSAVVLNVTATQPTKSGFLTVYPDGQPRPGTSSVDWVPGVSVPNLVTVPVLNGKVDFYNGSAGTVHVLADLAGYFGTDAIGGRYFQDGPTRVLDTRAAVGVPSTVAVAPGATVSLKLAGTAGVPGAIGAVTDAVMNVTVTSTTKTGFLTVYPDGQARPGTSNLDWQPGQTIANLVTVRMPTSGRVDLYNGSGGTVQILADLAGYYQLDLGGDSSTGGLYEPAKQVRVLDTRLAGGSPIPPGGSLVLSLAGYPVNRTGTNNGVLLNVTVTNPTAAGFLTVYPSGQSRPTTSSLDWAPNQTIANLVSVPIPASGDLVLYNGGGAGTVDVIADLVGSYQH